MLANSTASVFLYLILILILKAFFVVSSASKSQLQDNPTKTLLRLFFSCSIRFLFDFFFVALRKRKFCILRRVFENDNVQLIIRILCRDCFQAAQMCSSGEPRQNPFVCGFECSHSLFEPHEYAYSLLVWWPYENLCV